MTEGRSIHQAKAFYEKYGFVPLLENGFHLFLPIATFKKPCPASLAVRNGATQSTKWGDPVLIARKTG